MSIRATLEQVFAGPGASIMHWEAASRCTCFNEETHQPDWNHEPCGGYGVLYADVVEVRALFRSQGRWQSFRIEGQIPLGEAEFTTPAFDGAPGSGIVACRPAYTDDRIRDRFTVPSAIGDVDVGRVFYPASTPIPFIIGNTQLAWRVQLQSTQQDARLIPQP